MLSHAYINTELSASKDNSDFIKFVCDSAWPRLVFTFPEGSGKTANLRTLNDFFGQADISEHMAISRQSKYMELRGKHPIIFLDLADFVLKANGTLQNFAKQISELYKQFLIVRNSLTEDEKNEFDSFMNMQATRVKLATSLVKLMKFIKKHTNLETILLIDGYEKALQLDESLFELLGSLFHRALKCDMDNPLHLCVAMGSPVNLAQNPLKAGLLGSVGLFPNNFKFYSPKDECAKYFKAQRVLKMEEVVPPVLAVSDDCSPKNPTQVMSSTTKTTEKQGSDPGFSKLFI